MNDKSQSPVEDIAEQIRVGSAQSGLGLLTVERNGTAAKPAKLGMEADRTSAKTDRDRFPWSALA